MAYVWNADRYQRKVFENGLEALVPFREKLPGGGGFYEIVARRHDQLKFGTMHTQALQHPPTVEEVVRNNYLFNKDKVEKGICDLYGKYQGKTAIICGTGRSLLKDIETIKNTSKEDVVVICINDSLRPLIGRADFYFTLDWMSKREWLEGLDLSGVKLVCGLASPSHLTGSFKERYYFSGTLGSIDVELDKKYEHLGTLEQGFVASFSAMHLCQLLGVKRIVLAGHDQAYTDLWYHYNEKVSAERAKYLEAEAKEMDIHGNMTVTDFRMKRSAQMINCAALLLEEQGIACINASQDGILAMMRRADLKDCLGAEPPPLLEPMGEYRTLFNLGNDVIEYVEVN